MDQEAPQENTRDADGLAYVCQHRDALRDALLRSQPDHQEEDPAPLRRVLEAVCAQADLARPLKELHTALLDAGDALGVWGALRQGAMVVGGDQGVPFEPVYRCPLGLCAGRRPDNTTIFPLICTITDRELRQEIL